MRWALGRLMWPASLLAVAWTASLAVHRGTSAAATATNPAADSGAQAGPSLDYARVEGSDKCIDCHRAEYARWQASSHAGRTFDMLRTSTNSREYAKELDIPFDQIASNSLCLDCHATRQVLESGEMRVLAGVTCESCHNPSGGEDGWLNIHAVYGPPGTRRTDETKAHFKMRSEQCRAAGQLRSSDTYLTVRRCYECHLIGHEELVEAGHPAADRDWEFPGKALGEVRHNYHLNQSVNAEAATLWTDLHWPGKKTKDAAAARKRLLQVVGAMVDLELALRFMAKATDDGSVLFEDMAKHAGEAYKYLHDGILNEVDGGLPLVEQSLAAVEHLYHHVEETGESGRVDPRRMGRFLGRSLSPDDHRDALVEAADKVEAAARKFAAEHDGSKLTDLDEPEVPEGE